MFPFIPECRCLKRKHWPEPDSDTFFLSTNVENVSIYLEDDYQINLTLLAKSSSDRGISVSKMKVRLVFYTVPCVFNCKRVSVYLLYFSQ